MSFYNRIQEAEQLFDAPRFWDQVRDTDVQDAIWSESCTIRDFLTLLSPQAAQHLEAMAQRAHQLTVQYFGRTIQMFIPLYISNHCTNHCAYCGFNHKNLIARKKLTLEEIETEGRAILKTGMQHILLLTGEAPRETPIAYLAEAVRRLKTLFASVSIEIYPLDIAEYTALQEAGADGLTMFQETYNQAVYKRVHPAGRKRDYRWRLDAPERAARAGFRVVNIGPLLGLAEPRWEMFCTGLHAQYLADNFLDTEVAVSLPRFNDAECDFMPDYQVDDKMFVQFMTALRIFLPRAGITISTRESARFRNQILRLGVTRYSAGSSTAVGGYIEKDVDLAEQFSITDERSVAEVAQAILAQGYQPIYKDWDHIV